MSSSSSSSLSSVISNLVRASMGASVPSSVTDEELDRHVAELILKEAKQKAERYLKDGVTAYLPDKEPDPNLPKANKRFLSAIIRNTDEHNRAILRAQAEAAQEVKAEREEQERRERKARALEATEAERMRRLMGGSSRKRDMSWDRYRDGSRRRRSRDSREIDSSRCEDDGYEHKRRRHRSRSRSPVRKDDGSGHHRRRHKDAEVDRNEVSPKKHRRRSRPRIPEDGSRRTGHRHDRSWKAELQDESPKAHSRSRTPDECFGSSRKHELSQKLGWYGETLEDSSKWKGKGKETDEPTTAFSTLSHTPAAGTSRAASASGDSDVDTKHAASPSAGRSGRSLSPPRKASPADLSSQFKSRKSARTSPQPPASPTLSEEEDIERIRLRKRRRPSPSTQESKDNSHTPHPDSITSKMDKYFEESYDPRLDTGPLTLPTIPATGLIDGPEFESWEAMLDIIRQRREDKAERKRLERLGLLPDKEKKIKEKEPKSLKPSEAWTMASGTSAMDIKYSKKGAVREWDLGKGGF